MKAKPHTMKEIRARSEKGRRMARVRWQRDQERRRLLAAMDPLKAVAMGRKLIKRVIVITADQRAVEICRWADTSARQWAAMKRHAGV
jgi:hypothetical protein